MGIKVPDAATVGEKWNRKVQVAGPDYEAGVKNPSKDWKAATAESAPRQKEAVIQAANEGRFLKGVNASGDKWQRNVVKKGVARWGPGVADAQPDYQSGMAPVLNAIAGVNLPARYPAGDERNLERVRAVTTTVHKATKGK
jgi:hypothetical protein